MKKVLVSDPISKSGVKILEDCGIEVIYLPHSNKSELISKVKKMDGLIVRSGTIVDKDIIKDSRSLQVIGRAGVGVDNIDISFATRKGIVVMNTPDVNTISAAEHTVALLLTLSRNIHIGHYTLTLGEWNRNQLVGTELKNKVLGIIGLGKIGREVMLRCQSFGMKIIGHDPYVKKEIFEKEEIEIMGLDEVTKNADYITLHMPLNEFTTDLFDYNRLNNMKSTARIINVARGGIINENDLAKALENEVIAGAAIDVFCNEPLQSNNPLIGVKNILLSPHLGASTKEAKEGVSKAICEQVRDYLEYEKLSNVLNLPIQSTALLKELHCYLGLAELIGTILSQIIDEPILNVIIECQGTNEDIRPISMALIKGLLSPNIPDRINYINAESIAKELGIIIELRYKNVESNYQNVVSVFIKTKEKSFQLSGSVFNDKNPRLINVLGRDMEVTPKGAMIFLCNDDVPGVVGNIGTFFGRININIAAYLLNRDKNQNEAFAVIRLDKPLNTNEINRLIKMEGIKWAYQVLV